MEDLLANAFNTGDIKIVAVAAILYLIIYFQRKDTKSMRDDDSASLHDEILKHNFEITNLKGMVELHRDKLDSIDKQLNIVNQELVKLNIQVENLAKALERQNEIMVQQLQESKKK